MFCLYLRLNTFFLLLYAWNWLQRRTTLFTKPTTKRREATTTPMLWICWKSIKILSENSIMQNYNKRDYFLVSRMLLWLGIQFQFINIQQIDIFDISPYIYIKQKIQCKTILLLLIKKKNTLYLSYPKLSWISRD